MLDLFQKLKNKFTLINWFDIIIFLLLIIYFSLLLLFFCYTTLYEHILLT